MKKTVCALIVCAALLFCGCGPAAITDFPSYLSEGDYTVATGTVKAADIKQIVIEWVSGSVRIEESDVDQITFSEVNSLDEKTDSLGEIRKDKELTESLKMRYKTEGGTLTIRFCKSGLRVRAGAVKNLKKDLTVYGPAGTELDLIDVNVVSSDVYMNGIKSAKTTLNGVSASLKLADCTTGEAVIRTVSGSVGITSGTAPDRIEIESVSGKAALDLPSVSELKVDCVSADVSLSLHSADFTLTLAGISSALEVNGFKYDKKEDRTYVFGSGEGTVSIQSVSGSVLIESK